MQKIYLFPYDYLIKDFQEGTYGFLEFGDFPKKLTIPKKFFSEIFYDIVMTVIILSQKSLRIPLSLIFLIK